MDKIIVGKSPPLCGSVKISGAKNSALPILAATLLLDGETQIKNVPKLKDIELMLKLLESFGSSITYKNETVTIKTEKIKSYIAPYEYVSGMRASFLVMGPLLARIGKTRISLPGGCPIGTRPVDLHLKGFSNMGAQITTGHGYVEAKAQKLCGTKIYLDFPSVGATENLIMAAVLAEGKTIIQNAATEPEIVDLAAFLNKAGADIKGVGTDNIIINGVASLNGVKHKIIPDRIEAGTFMVAAAMTHGKVELTNVNTSHLKPITAKLEEIGAEICDMKNSIIISAENKLKCTDIKTLPFPGFPTDMQAQMTTLMSTIDGTSIIVETIFENRFMHVGELNRMGANIKIDGRSAVVTGTKQLTGAQVKATDLRAGAALILAGLNARGKTEIGDIDYIDRGYFNIVGKMAELGADIKRISET